MTMTRHVEQKGPDREGAPGEGQGGGNPLGDSKVLRGLRQQRDPASSALDVEYTGGRSRKITKLQTCNLILSIFI